LREMRRLSNTVKTRTAALEDIHAMLTLVTRLHYDKCNGVKLVMAAMKVGHKTDNVLTEQRNKFITIVTGLISGASKGATLAGPIGAGAAAGVAAVCDAVNNALANSAAVDVFRNSVLDTFIDILMALVEADLVETGGNCNNGVHNIQKLFNLWFPATQSVFDSQFDDFAVCAPDKKWYASDYSYRFKGMLDLINVYLSPEYQKVFSKEGQNVFDGLQVKETESPFGALAKGVGEVKTQYDDAVKDDNMDKLFKKEGITKLRRNRMLKPSL